MNTTVKAVFLDRDGTLNSDEGHYYIWKKEDFRFNPGVIEGLLQLQQSGFLLFVVTNQGGVAKGIYSTADVENLHEYMCEQLQSHGIHIRKIYYCPHHESVQACDCRKPSPEMILRAIKEFNIDPRHSYLIGDGDRDIEAATSAGITGIKIEKNQDLRPAVEMVLKRETEL